MTKLVVHLVNLEQVSQGTVITLDANSGIVGCRINSSHMGTAEGCCLSSLNYPRFPPCRCCFCDPNRQHLLQPVAAYMPLLSVHVYIAGTWHVGGTEECSHCSA